MRSSARPGSKLRQPITPALRVRISSARGDDGFLMGHTPPGVAVVTYDQRKKLRTSRAKKAFPLLVAFVAFCLSHAFDGSREAVIRWFLSF